MKIMREGEMRRSETTGGDVEIHSLSRSPKFSWKWTPGGGFASLPDRREESRRIRAGEAEIRAFYESGEWY